MPQISQLSEIFASQLFWLAVVFGIIYFVIARGMVPKIRSTVDAREARIAADLQGAQAAREDADRTEAEWRSRMDAARAEAARISQTAQQVGSADTEKKVKAAAEKISKKIEAAQARIREATVAARTEIETFAAEAAQEMVQRLTGITVDSKDAAEAVRAELNV